MDVKTTKILVNAGIAGLVSFLGQLALLKTVDWQLTIVMAVIQGLLAFFLSLQKDLNNGNGTVPLNSNNTASSSNTMPNLSVKRALQFKYFKTCNVMHDSLF